MRSLRVLRILPLGYSHLVYKHINKIPEFNELSYAEQKKELIRYAPSHLNSFSECLQNLGHECTEIIFDLEENRIKWALENNAP